MSVPIGQKVDSGAMTIRMKARTMDGPFKGDKKMQYADEKDSLRCRHNAAACDLSSSTLAHLCDAVDRVQLFHEYLPGFPPLEEMQAVVIGFLHGLEVMRGQEEGFPFKGREVDPLKLSEVINAVTREMQHKWVDR
jgi:hypothetical protein